MQLDIWKKEHDHEITFTGQTSKNSEWKQKEEQNALKQKKNRRKVNWYFILIAR